jgi:hypothetical protein
MARNDPTRVRVAVFCGLVIGLFAPALHALFAQRQSPAEGPWTGQAQCVVVAKWADYLDEQTHTWRLTGATPTTAPRGSAQVYFTWPATWSVQGGGRKAFPRATGVPSRDQQTERWTIATEMNATLRMTEIAGQTLRLRIGADGQRGAPLGSIRVTDVSGRTSDGSVQPWPFPTIEDEATKTAISGSSTRTYPEGVGNGWSRPPKAITTATCTWNFTRRGVEQSSANPSTGGRGRTPIAGLVLATPASETPASGPRTITATPGGSTGTASSTGRAAAAGPGSTTPPAPASSQSPDASPFAGATGGGVRLGDPVACTTPGPDVEPAVTPTSVRFAWRSLAGATGYIVADRNGNPLTPAPITQLTYTHNAAHHHSFSYSYSVTAILASGGCTITRLTFTPPPPLTPQVTMRVIASNQPGRVTLTWGDQSDLPDYYLVLGPGIPPNGAEVTASRSGQSYEIAQLPAGTHRWSVTPFWRAPGEIVGDDALGARVTATIFNIGPRTFELAGFSARGTAVVIPPRTIAVTGFTGAGTGVVIPPRTITLSGFTGTGARIQGVVR